MEKGIRVSMASLFMWSKSGDGEDFWQRMVNLAWAVLQASGNGIIPHKTLSASVGEVLYAPDIFLRNGLCIELSLSACCFVRFPAQAPAPYVKNFSITA